MNPLAGLSLPVSCAQSPCRTITVDFTLKQTYKFYIYASALGTTNDVHSEMVTINVICDLLSSDITTTVESPPSGTVVTFDANGPIMYLDFTVVNTAIPSCGVQSYITTLNNVVFTG